MAYSSVASLESSAKAALEAALGYRLRDLIDRLVLTVPGISRDQFRRESMSGRPDRTGDVLAFRPRRR